MARVALALVTLLASAVVLIDTVEGRKRVDRPSSAAEAQSAPAAADDGKQIQGTGGLLTPVPPWTRVEDYLVNKKLRTVRVPEIETLIKDNCYRAKQCGKYCACPEAANLSDGSPECCVWSATALDNTPLGERGCLIDVKFGEVSEVDFETQKIMKEKGTYHPMADLILGAHGDDTDSFGVHGLKRCEEIEPGERVYFSGGVAGAAGTVRLMIEVYSFGDEARHISDAHAAVRACDEEIVGDMWWGESEWTTTRAWLRHELEEEGDAMLLEQLRELEEWAVKASARALAAASRGTTEEQGGSGVGSIRAEIEALYEKHNPSKIAAVPDLLAKYAGMEGELLASIREKYGRISIDKDEL